ncbi:MAG: hypothetical protein ACPLWB_07205 [Caldisericia bacterium]
MSNNFFTQDDFSQNEIFINYWDIDKGKIYLNYEKLYSGFKQGIYSYIFPYFWDGENLFYLNCNLKEINKMNLKLYLSSPPEIPQFSLFKNNPIKVNFNQENLSIEIYEEIDKKIVLKNKYNIEPSLLPNDLVYDQEIYPFIVLEKENSELKIIFLYSSFDMNKSNKILTKLFILSINKDEIKIIETKGISNYSISWLFSDSPYKNFFIKDDKIFLNFCCNQENLGLLWSLDLNIGEFKEIIESLKFNENYTSVEERFESPKDNYIGFYKDYYIFYNNDELIATNGNGEIIGKINILKKEKRIEVYKNGKLIQSLNIKNINSNIQFPNYFN